MKFGIVSDGSCDLAEHYTEEEKVSIVPFYVSFDGEHYLKEGKEAKITDFYQKMADNPDCYPKTSMPSVQDYMEVFRPFAEQGLFVKEAVRLRNAEAELDEALEELKEIRSTGHIFFTTKDLKYLEHGGRIGKAACLAGSMLNIKPILHFYDTQLGSTELCRGRKKSLHKIIEIFFAYVEGNEISLEDYNLVTGEGLAVEEYQVFKDELKSALREHGCKMDSWEEIQIGATIGVHTGPYRLRVGILKKRGQSMMTNRFVYMDMKLLIQDYQGKRK